MSKDYARAVDYYQRAAAAGEVGYSALALANIYATGEGVPVDRSTAFGWIVIADELGDAAIMRQTFQSALTTYSAGEQAAGRSFAQRFADDYARRTGIRLALPAPP